MISHLQAGVLVVEIGVIAVLMLIGALPRRP